MPNIPFYCHIYQNSYKKIQHRALMVAAKDRKKSIHRDMPQKPYLRICQPNFTFENNLGNKKIFCKPYFITFHP